MSGDRGSRLLHGAREIAFYRTSVHFKREEFDLFDRGLRRFRRETVSTSIEEKADLVVKEDEQSGAPAKELQCTVKYGLNSLKFAYRRMVGLLAISPGRCTSGCRC